MERSPGPDISGTVLPERLLKLREPQLLDEGDGLRAEKKMCNKAGKVNYECQTELEYVTAEEAAKLGLPASTRVALHKCVRPGSAEGAFVPVNSVEAAMRVSDEFCNCVGAPKAPPLKAVAEQAKYVASEKRQKCARQK